MKTKKKKRRQLNINKSIRWKWKENCQWEKKHIFKMNENQMKNKNIYEWKSRKEREK